MTFRLGERDEAGARILSDLRELGISQVVEGATSKAAGLVRFFKNLKAELSFYLGCVNLHKSLRSLNIQTSFPKIKPEGTQSGGIKNIVDLALVFGSRGIVVPNDFNCGGHRVVIITGANQGGKTSFLRALGQQFLLMRAGCFVAASEFEAPLYTEIFTHFRTSEEEGSEVGRLEEELSRISSIIDHLTPGSLLLSNESFSATNDSEASALAEQVIFALADCSVSVFLVTHLTELSTRALERHTGETEFLRAERRPDGVRTFRILKARPLPSGFAKDIYEEVFGPRTEPKTVTV